MTKMRESRKREKSLLKKKAQVWYILVRDMDCMAGEQGFWHECFGEVIHHHKTGAGVGAKDAYDETMPLCVGHHTSNNFGNAIHNGTKSFEKKYLTQDEMIRITRERIRGQDYEMD